MELYRYISRHPLRLGSVGTNEFEADRFAQCLDSGFNVKADENAMEAFLDLPPKNSLPRVTKN